MRQETTENELHDIIELYEGLLSTIPIGLYRFRMKAGGGWLFDFVNSRFCELSGLNREDVLNNYETALRLIHHEDLPEFISLIESVEKNAAPFAWEGRLIVDGQPLWMSVESRPTVMDNGDLVWSGYFTDITGRKRAEEALRESEERWKFALEGARDGVWDWNAQTNEVFFSKRWKAMLGYQEQEIGTTLDEWDKRVHQDDVERCYADLQRHFGGETPFYENEHRMLCKDGSYKWILDRGKVVEWADDGKPLRVIGTHTDITERKRVEEALRLSEAQKSAILNGIGANIAFVNDKLEIIWVNRTAAESVGRSPEKMIGATCHSFWANPERPCENCPTLKAFQTRQPQKVIMTTPDGKVWDERGEPVFDDQGNLIGVVELAQDITDLKRTEEALRNSEARYRQLADVTFEGIIFHDEGVLLQANNQFFKMYGYEPDELVGTQIMEKTLTPESVKTVRAHVAERSTETYAAVGLRKDGTTFPIEIRARMRELEGKKIRATAIRDISRLKNVEAQLLQSQKLEALGTLVGGIAHDFNNMLQIILGYSDLLLSDKTKSEPCRNELKTIIETAKGGADLVTKLLAFGQQTPIFPVSLDLNHQISQLTSLMSRTLPQVVQIDLDLVDEPTTIHADANQIDQMLMDLAINAAEAMPDGGRLKISTRTVSFNGEYCRSCNGAKLGSYVTLSVMDTGRGMDKETLSRIFEPFFSTKQRGSTRGTGLGLSVVKGIVQQHGGHIDCESEPGKGTAFRIYFPASEEPLADVKSGAATVQSGGSETILVVEDSIPVADLEERFLTGAGYTVIVATNGREALDIYRSRREEISLVVLDLLMPEMSGRDGLMELLKIDPSVRVIIASGYAPEDELHKEILPLVKGFLQKPFAMTELVEEVRCGLDNCSS
ncbi:MAG: PAS domain S-box protein [Pseudomonadota bacterium]